MENLFQRPKKFIKNISHDPFSVAVFFLAFVMVFVKKWEPGGNLDTIWDSALARNIAESGDYFHWYISKYYFNPVFDHLPLTYWTLATLMKIFGVSDLVARTYPMFCSFFSYILVYKIGSYLKDKEFGLVCVLSYVTCFGSSKWNGAVTQDVPLTTYFLATTYTFLLGRNNCKYWLWSAVFFALGVFTKGPIIFGLGLGFFAWSLYERDFFYIKDRSKRLPFITFLCFLTLLLLIPLLPFLRFDGLTAYQMFFKAKTSYIASPGTDYWHYFAYFGLIPQTATLTVIPFFYTFWLLAKKKTELSEQSNSILRLCLFIALGVIIPLSLFKTKFPHYLLSCYPYMAIFAAPSFYKAYKWLQNKYFFNLPVLIKRLSITALCVFVALPIKTTGGRAKEEMNLTNAIKLDSNIKNKDVYFYGTYEDNMIIFQTFKFYGAIDLKSLTGNALTQVDLKRSYVVIQKNKLPLTLGAFNVTTKDCFMGNETLCVLTDPQSVSLIYPDKVYPHEIY